MKILKGVCKTSLNRLFQAVNSLRESNISNARGSQSDNFDSQENVQDNAENSGYRESTENSINRLFPSARGGTTRGKHCRKKISKSFIILPKYFCPHGRAII